MKSLLLISLAPVFIIAWYIYYRDKWEKEPISLLIASILLGALAVLPILFVESYLIKNPLFVSNSIFSAAAYDGFVVAGFSEEFFKFLVFMLLIWGNKNFNEKFDGIVYAVFISLGFAGIENLMYVFNYGIQTGYVRAITAVPLHAIVGVIMGYHFGLAKLGKIAMRPIHLILALLLPIFFHGLYDWIVMINQSWYLFLFIPYLFFLWHRAFRRMRTLSDTSRFKPVDDKWEMPKD